MTVSERRGDLANIRARLDEALLRLREVADRAVPLREAERLIAATLVHVYRAMESGDDYGEFHDALNHALERARAALHLLGQIDTDDGAAARELVVLAQIVRDLRRVEYGSDREAGEDASAPRKRDTDGLRASKRVPTLLHLDRAYIFPAVPLPPEEKEEPGPEASGANRGSEETTDIEVLFARALAAASEADRERDEPTEPRIEPAEARPEMGPPVDEELEREYVGTQLSESDVLLDTARVCFEELGTFGWMRRPLEDQTWTGRDKPERRLLARVDAIVACGLWVLPHLVRMLGERPLPDPELTWAAIFLFGSIAGSDALDQAVRVVRASTLEVEPVRRAVVDALAHAPHTQVSDVMRSWLADRDAAARSVAVSVLARRGALGLWDALRATHDSDERVILAGAEGIGRADGRPSALEMEAVLHDPRPSVAIAAVTSAILQRIEAGALRATELTRGGHAEYAHAASLAAVAGRGRAVLDALTVAMSGPKSAPLIRAIGWFGHASLMDALLDQLRDGDPGLVGVTIEALQRLTGASLTEECPDPSYGPDEQPFTRGYRPPAAVAQLSEDPDAWSAWWRRHRPSADERARYRFGHRWSVHDNLWELESPTSRPADRWIAYLEIVARTSVTAPFDPEAFVWQQGQQLRSLRQSLGHHLARPLQDGWAVQYVR